MKHLTVTLTSLLATLPLCFAEPDPMPFHASIASGDIRVDGDLSDWPATSLTSISIIPATDDPRNRIGYSTAEFAIQTNDDDIFIAVRWPDSSQNLIYRPWKWSGNRYRRSNQLDDMLAVRFNLDDAYDRSMLAELTYRVDTWLWSSARTNPVGYAEDGLHIMSLDYLEKATEHKLESGKILYIKRITDEGQPGYSLVKPPKEKSAAELGSVEWVTTPSGSIADVAAAGVWRDGYWTLELKRKRVTTDNSDRSFLPGDTVLMQLAFFDQSGEEHKSITEPIRLILP